MLVAVFSRLPNVTGSSVILSNTVTEADLSPLRIPREGVAMLSMALREDRILSADEGALLAGLLVSSQKTLIDMGVILGVAPPPLFWRLLPLTFYFKDKVDAEMKVQVVPLCPNSSVIAAALTYLWEVEGVENLVVDFADVLSPRVIAMLSLMCEISGVSLYLVYRGRPLRGLWAQRIDINESLYAHSLLKALSLPREEVSEVRDLLPSTRVSISRKGFVSLIALRTPKSMGAYPKYNYTELDVLRAVFGNKAESVRSLLDEVKLSGGAVDERSLMDWCSSLGLSYTDYANIVKYGFLGRRVHTSSVTVYLTDKGMYVLGVRS